MIVFDDFNEAMNEAIRLTVEFPISKRGYRESRLMVVCPNENVKNRAKKILELSNPPIFDGKDVYLVNVKNRSEAWKVLCAEATVSLVLESQCMYDSIVSEAYSRTGRFPPLIDKPDHIAVEEWQPCHMLVHRIGGKTCRS
jgi:hypothetical protein